MISNARHILSKSKYIGWTIVFFLISIIGVYYHELWLDEAHHWLLARDSNSLPDLITKTRQEGHPILWNILLYGISRFTSNPIWMQLLHVTITSTAVYLFLKQAPFKLLFKLVFIFGYYMLFEYTVLSRNYSLGILFLFLACSLYPNRHQKPIPYFIALALVANTQAMFLVFSGGLALLWIIEHLQQHKFKIPKKTWLGVFILASGIVLALVQIIPPENNALLNSARQIPFQERISKSLIGFFKGMAQLPDFRTSNFWNSNIFVNWSKPLSGVLGMGSLFIPLFLFSKNRLILFFVYISIFVTFIMLYITQLSAARYHGIFVLILIVAFWLEYEHSKRPFTVYQWIPESILKTIRKSLIIGIFGLHLVSGITAYAMDITLPFTQAKRSITFLKDSQLDHKIIATKACDGTALSAYLERPIFFTSYNTYCSYCIWGDPEQVKGKSEQDVLQSLKGLLEQTSESIIFIAYQPFFATSQNWITTDNGVKYKFLKNFEQSILNKGNYYIYEVALLD